jgi:hypothetical protein
MTRPNHDHLVNRIKDLQCILTRYFADKHVRVLGHAWHVADIIDVFEDYIAQLEHGGAASAAWIEATTELDELGGEVRPLLSAVRDLISGVPDDDDSVEDNVEVDFEDPHVDDMLRHLLN